MRDINGKTIRRGSVVRRAARGSDIIPIERRSGKGSIPPAPVLAIGQSGTELAGRVCVETTGGFRVWERPEQFERVRL